MSVSLWLIVAVGYGQTQQPSVEGAEASDEAGQEDTAPEEDQAQPVSETSGEEGTASDTGEATASETTTGDEAALVAADGAPGTDGGAEKSKTPVEAGKAPSDKAAAKEEETLVEGQGLVGTDLQAVQEPKERVLFEKGDMEMALNLAMAGGGNDFYFGVGGTYAYYVIKKLGLGIDVQYNHLFSDSDFGYTQPHALTFLPFLKYVVLQTKNASPYIFVTGGYRAEFGSDVSVNAWILGGGGGVHVGLTDRFAINIQLMALHYWYSGRKVYEFKDSKFVEDEMEEVPTDPDNPDSPTEMVPTGDRFFVGCGDPSDRETCRKFSNSDDKNDVEKEWFFPLITIGLTYYF